MISERYKQLRYEEGRRVGREEGLEVGREEGREVGWEEGREVGREEGREVGREVGREEGREEGIKVAELALASQRQRFRQFLQKAGVELNDEDAESLFGSPDELAQDNGAKG